tara:strand:+ start:4274 stop:4471 length:198 start_codon:yes stop_codon:yes gene_type:complete
MSEEVATKPDKEKLQATLPPSLMKRLKLIAETQDLSVSEVVQRALSEWIENNYCEKIAFWSTELT